MLTTGHVALSLKTSEHVTAAKQDWLYYKVQDLAKGSGSKQWQKFKSSNRYKNKMHCAPILPSLFPCAYLVFPL